MHAHLPPPNPERYVEFPSLASGTATVAPTPLLQVLPWDFHTSFPEPLQEAIEAGKLYEDDAHPDNLKSLHEEHAQHALTLLSDLDAVMDAKRRGVDPRTGKAPRTPIQREKLDALFRDEPARLEHAFDVLMDVYEEAFGAEPTDAFRKAIRAWHAGIDVVSEHPPNAPPRAESIEAGVFGWEEDGAVVEPGAEEIADVTEQLTDRLMPLPDGEERAALLAKYAEDFGEEAARELDRWCRLKPEAEEAEPFSYDPGHPWHYYYEGDGAEPLPLDSIPARATSLEQFGVKWPTNPTKRRAMMEQMLKAQRDQLALDVGRYRELIDQGVEALTRYDREIAHGGNDDLALASSIALKYTHISSGRGRVQCLERQLEIPLQCG